MSIDYERRRMQLQVYYGNLLYSVLYSFPIAISRDFVSDYHITSLLVIEPILVLNLVRTRSSWLGIGTEPAADRSPIRRSIV